MSLTSVIVTLYLIQSTIIILSVASFVYYLGRTIEFRNSSKFRYYLAYLLYFSVMGLMGLLNFITQYIIGVEKLTGACNTFNMIVTSIIGGACFHNRVISSSVMKFMLHFIIFSAALLLLLLPFHLSSHSQHLCRSK